MYGTSETEALSHLCRRFCAVDEDGNAPDGYFRFDAGTHARGAKKAAGNVEWSTNADAVLGECVDRVNMLHADGHVKVWVRAVARPNTHPSASCRFDNADPEAGEDGSALAVSGRDGALGVAHSQVVTTLVRLVESQNRALEQRYDERQEMAVSAMQLGMIAQAAQDQSSSANFAAAARAAAPALAATLPLLAHYAFGGSPGQAPEMPPSDAKGAALWHCERLERAAAGLVAAAQADPEAISPAVRARLAAMAQLAAAAAAARPEPEPDQGDDPEDAEEVPEPEQGVA